MSLATHYKHGRTGAICGSNAWRTTEDKAGVTCKRCMKSLGIEVVKEEKLVTPQVVLDELVRMFAEVEPKFIEETRSSYREQADHELNVWLTQLEAPKSDYISTNRRGRKVSNIPSSGRYVQYEGMHGSTIAPFHWEQKQENRDNYYADHRRAQNDADASVELAKGKFIFKQGEKVANALKGRTDLGSVKGRLGLRSGTVVGSININMQNGDSFTLHQQIIINYRYEPHYTSFYQFPARFHDIRKGEVEHATQSEAWMKENF